MPAPSFDEKSLEPARKIIASLVRPTTGAPPRSPESRAQLLMLADLALTRQYPAARSLSPQRRKELLEQALGPASGLESIPENAAVAAAALPATAATEPPPPDAPGESVQGLLVDAETADQAAVDAATAAALGPGWTATKVEGTSASYHLTHPGLVLSVQEGWELAHRIADQPQIAAAEPVIEWTPAAPEVGGVPVNPLALQGFESLAPQPDDRPEWSFEMINVKAAWDAATAAGRPARGKGIKIAHLDTGVTYHKELPALDGASILLRQGANFYDAARTGNLPLDSMDAGAVDVLKTWFIPLNGHGTGTLSVLLSPPGAQGGDAQRYVSGVAPDATVVPIRVAPTVVHWNLKRMIDAIRFAHQAGCQVFTMSMGGPPPAGRALDEVVGAAVEDGVIFCSAAGNVIGNQDWFPIVVWPAAMDPVIAVGGGNVRKQAWNGSSRGPEVNISAPAEHVWHAAGRKGALKPTDPAGTESVPGNGTSFATPATAGLAACWLAYHGRDALVRKYGHPRYIPRAFAWLLRNVAFNTPPDWKTKLLGPGIIDGGKLLAAPLPEKGALAAWPQKRHALSSHLLAGLFKAVYIVTPGGFETASASALPVASEAALEDDERAAILTRRLGGELLYHLFDRPALAHALLQGTPRGLEAVPEGVMPGASVFAAPADAKAALRAVASETLGRALAPAYGPGLDHEGGGGGLAQRRGNLLDDAPAAAEIGQPATGAAGGLEERAPATRPWRVARSLEKLLGQVNAKAPHRDRSYDGTIGDAAHQSRASDHNPWVVDGGDGVVTALDITHDPHGGCDAGAIVEAIRAARDARVKYLIWNRRIANHAAIGSSAAWAWRPYGGANPHDHHCHISVLPEKEKYDSEAAWAV